LQLVRIGGLNFEMLNADSCIARANREVDVSENASRDGFCTTIV
jgi:hypothetical protein